MGANSLHLFRAGLWHNNTRFVLTTLLCVCALLAVGCNTITGDSDGPRGFKAPAQAVISLQPVLPGPTVGQAYDSVISVAGGGAPYSFWVSAGQLPQGLSLNPSTGAISGTPSQAGQTAFTVSVRGRFESSGARTYTMAVSSCTGCVTVQISPMSPSIAPGRTQQFAATVTNTGNTAVIWSASAGNITSGGLFTAPESATNSTVTITVTSAAQSSANASTTVSLTSSKLTIVTSSLPSALVGAAYSAQLTASGGTPPYRWNISSGSLPQGLQLASNSGTIAGSPSQGGASALNVSVADAAAHTAQENISLVVSNQESKCGPPSYCSRTDLAIVQLPSSPPKVGNLVGANTLVTDPDFANPIVRITDFSTDPSAPTGPPRTFVSATSGSADENLWNTDSTLFLIEGDGGAAYPFSFDPSTMQASRLYVSSNQSTGGMKLSGGGTWSRVNPNVLYETPGTSIAKYDFSNRSVAPSAQTVYDYAASGKCLPAGFSETWKSRGGVSAGDTAFAMAFSNEGGQGTGVYAVVYKLGSGCALLNTKTGQVSGEWGEQGKINIPDRWTIHNVKLSKDGNWLIVGATTCTSSSCQVGPYFWQVGTKNVGSCGDAGHCSGHWTEGYTHWENNNNTPFGNEVIRSFAATTTTNLTTDIPPGIVTPFDQHQSWNNVDPADSVPFLAATWSSISPFPAAWYNEIIGVAADGSGTVWRFAHSFITTKSQSFSTQYAIGSVSQDGRFFLFSSDWMGKLGSEDGSESCTIGENCRGDVFVVELN